MYILDCKQLVLKTVMSYCSLWHHENALSQSCDPIVGTGTMNIYHCMRDPFYQLLWTHDFIDYQLVLYKQTHFIWTRSEDPTTFDFCLRINKCTKCTMLSIQHWLSLDCIIGAEIILVEPIILCNNMLKIENWLKFNLTISQL